MALCVLACLAWQCSPRAPRQPKARRFAHEAMLKTTPVADQGSSDLCWMYAMLSTIETERLMMGDSVRLSVTFLARKHLERMATERFLGGKGARISMRGMPSMALNLLDEHGMVTYDAYHDYHAPDYRGTLSAIKRLAALQKSLSGMQSAVGNLLDAKMGALPMAVYLFGAQYTPQEFGRSVCHPHGYVALTSFSHHPFGHSFVLETPDNLMRDTFLNVRIDQLVAIADRSIRHGHPVCWEGDISEKGFSWKEGVADISTPAESCTQERRQRDFERRKTTDDHCMALVGIAHDANGRKFFVAKNSWGTANAYGGYIYLSYEYLKMKTIAIYLSNEAYNIRL